MKWIVPFKYAKSYPHWPFLKDAMRKDDAFTRDNGYWKSQEEFNKAWRVWYYGSRE